MNRHQLADERSKALHRKIAAKLQQFPELWEMPEQNIRRWAEQMGGVLPATDEWYQILRQRTHSEILALLISDSEEAQRLRSSSPFTGILTEAEREETFRLFRLSGRKTRNSRSE